MSIQHGTSQRLITTPPRSLAHVTPNIPHGSPQRQPSVKLHCTLPHRTYLRYDLLSHTHTHTRHIKLDCVILYARWFNVTVHAMIRLAVCVSYSCPWTCRAVSAISRQQLQNNIFINVFTRGQACVTRSFQTPSLTRDKLHHTHFKRKRKAAKLAGCLGLVFNWPLCSI